MPGAVSAGWFRWIVPLAAVVLVAGCRSPILTVDDAIVGADGKVRLIAYVEQEPILGIRRDVRDVRVHFSVNGREVGSDKTDDNGRATEKCRIDAGVGTFDAEAVVHHKTLRARGRVFRWDDRRVAIAVDVDHTLERTDYQDLLLDDDDDSNPVKRSAKTLRSLADGFHILYLTARPRFLLDKTREWLDEEGFPPGPVVAAKGMRQTLRPGEFKRRSLHALRKDWPSVLIGVGDQPGDARAYGANDMLSLMLGRASDRRFGPHSLVFRGWKELSRFLVANQETLADPDDLSDAIDGKVMLRQPVQPYDQH